MKINKILVPYDGTPSSTKAFDSALGLAKKHESTIFIFTCIPDQATFGFFKTKSDKLAVQKQKNLAENQMQVLEHKAKNVGVSIIPKIIITHGFPSECIVSYSSENKIDLIVMSTSKLVPAEKKQYISTVENVFKNAKCALLVVR